MFNHFNINLTSILKNVFFKLWFLFLIDSIYVGQQKFFNKILIANSKLLKDLCLPT